MSDFFEGFVAAYALSVIVLAVIATIIAVGTRDMVRKRRSLKLS